MEIVGYVKRVQDEFAEGVGNGGGGRCKWPIASPKHVVKDTNYKKKITETAFALIGLVTHALRNICRAYAIV